MDAKKSSLEVAQALLHAVASSGASRQVVAATASALFRLVTERDEDAGSLVINQRSFHSQKIEKGKAEIDEQLGKLGMLYDSVKKRREEISAAKPSSALNCEARPFYPSVYPVVSSLRLDLDAEDVQENFYSRGELRRCDGDFAEMMKVKSLLEEGDSIDQKDCQSVEEITPETGNCEGLADSEVAKELTKEDHGSKQYLHSDDMETNHEKKNGNKKEKKKRQKSKRSSDEENVYDELPPLVRIQRKEKDRHEEKQYDMTIESISESSRMEPPLWADHMAHNLADKLDQMFQKVLKLDSNGVNVSDE